MIPSPPEVYVWLEIPEDCRIRGEFTGERDIQLSFGNANKDATNLANVLFERPALERLARLAFELLAVPLPDDPKADLPVIVSPAA